MSVSDTGFEHHSHVQCETSILSSSAANSTAFVSDTDLTWFQENWPMLSADDREAVREHVDHLVALRVTGGVR